MSWYLRACGLGALVIAGADTLVAQKEPCPEAAFAESERLARTFAPVLRFGPGERYFPTIPFFQAFDTLDGGRGFLDSARVAPLNRQGRISWDSLDAAYRRRVVRQERAPELFLPRLAAVFYRVRCLVKKQNKQLWGFLRNDHQAWNRSGLDSLYGLGLKHAQFATVEYFLYYIRDVGLQGHEHDIERLVVFVPRRIATSESIEEGGKGERAAREGSQAGLVDSLRILVGTGHSPTTPNNVLVVLNEQAKQLRLPSVLIELGGHASAPDLDRDSELHPGLDINWNLNADVWGTRDGQAVSGSGYLGEYKSWMTLPRYPGKSVILADIAQRRALRPILDTVQTPSGQDVGQEQRDEEPSGAPPAEQPTDSAYYALLPVSLFQNLAAHAVAITRGATLEDSTRIAAAARALVSDSIRPRLREGWGFKGWADTSTAGVIAALGWIRYWSKPLEGKKPKPSNATIWLHPEYGKSPILVLKRRLYRPAVSGIQNLGDFGSLFTFSYGAYLGRGGQQAQIGFILPSLRGKLHIPGYIEAQLGLYRRRLFGAEGEVSRPSFTVLYERHWRRLFSWYVKPINYVRRRPEIEGDAEASDLALGFGASVMPFWPFPQLFYGIPKNLRFRAGLRIDARGLEPTFRRLEIQATYYIR